MASQKEMAEKVWNLFDHIYKYEVMDLESQLLIDLIEEKHMESLDFWSSDEIGATRYYIHNIYEIFDESHPDYAFLERLVIQMDAYK